MDDCSCPSTMPSAATRQWFAEKNRKNLSNIHQIHSSSIRDFYSRYTKHVFLDSKWYSLIIKYWLQPATLIHAANYTITRCPQTQNISDNDNHLAETLTKSNQWFKSRFIQIPVYAGQLPKWSGFIPGHFTEFRVKSGRWVTVGDMLIKLRKGPILHGEGSGKVFQNLYLGSEHHQKLISSSDW